MRRERVVRGEATINVDDVLVEVEGEHDLLSAL